MGRPAAGASPRANILTGEIRPRDVLNTAYALALSGAMVNFALCYSRANYYVLGICLTIVAVAAVGVLTRHWIPFAAGVAPLLLAHLMFWGMAASRPGLVWLKRPRRHCADRGHRGLHRLLSMAASRRRGHG